MTRTMCKISVDTVIRANKRTIQQSRSQQIHYGEVILHTSELSVSVSVMGVICLLYTSDAADELHIV